MGMAEVWFLVAFLMSSQGDGKLAMSSTVLGVSKTYASKANCHNAASHLDERFLAEAKKQNGKVAMMCVQGWVYD